MATAWRRFRRYLAARRLARQYDIAALAPRDLEDLGLHHSDRQAIAAGLLTRDATRRQR